MRTIVDIPETQLRRLDVKAKTAGVSRAELIRRALDAWLGPTEVLGVAQVFGLWGNGAVAGRKYQKRIRRDTRLKLPDAIVLATAVETDRILVTRDKDFPAEGAVVQRPYVKGTD